MRNEPGRRILSAGLAAVVLYLCCFHGLDALGLVGPDEPRYAAVAREMAESGDWVTPRLHGEPWFEKPILYYWGAAAFFRMFGAGEFAARLPSALMAAVVVLTLVWLAHKHCDPATGFAASCMFPACVASIGYARAATTDMLFTGFLMLAMAAATQILFAPAARQVLRRVAWGVFLGLATLAKGPAAIVLAGGSVALWVVAGRKWRDVPRLLHPASLAAFALVALPWYVLCAMRNPEFVDVFLISHNMDRFLTPVFLHQQPFWFFGPMLLLGVAPWTLLLIAPLRDAWRAAGKGDWAEGPALFWVCWLLFPLLFFSFSKSKLPGYILPVIPALLLLTARSLTRASHQSPWLARGLGAGVGVSLAALGFFGGRYAAHRLPEETMAMLPQSMTWWMAGLSAVGIVLAIMSLREANWAIVGGALLTAVLVLGVTRGVLPAVDAHFSARAAAQAVSRKMEAGESVSAFRVHRAWQYGFDFYLQRRLPEWAPGQNSAMILTSDTGVQDLLAQGYTIHVVERAGPQAMLVRVDRRDLTASEPAR